MLSPEELRLEIAGHLRDEFGLDAQIQGKRIVVTGDDDRVVILVTKVTREALLREVLGSAKPS